MPKPGFGFDPISRLSHTLLILLVIFTGSPLGSYLVIGVFSIPIERLARLRYVRPSVDPKRKVGLSERDAPLAHGPAICSSDAANRALLTASDPAVRDMASGRTVSCGRPSVICQNSNAGSSRRMIVALNCGANGILYWYVFAESTSGSWQLSQEPNEVFEAVTHGSLDASTKIPNELILKKPIYLSGDPECCPAGGRADLLLQWSGDHFVEKGSISHSPRECAQGIRRSEFEMFSHPYKTRGRCYELLAHVVQWFGPNAALMSVDFGESLSSGFSVMVDFPDSPDKSILRLLAVGEGAYTYTNTLGALVTVPRVRVVQVMGQGAF